MKIVVISHGSYSKGSVDALDMITGMGKEIIYKEMREDIQGFEKEINNICKEEDCIFLADLVGGHPFNTAVKSILTNKKDKQMVIGGYNLAILIEVVMASLNNDVEGIDKIINQHIGSTMQLIKNW